MMKPVFRIDATGANPVAGRPVLDLPKALWNGGMIAGAVMLPFFYTTPAAVAMCIALTYITLLLGHSIGMHRLMIHKSFVADRWLERALMYIGVLVGMGGPSNILKIHDLRDWAQRQRDCHDFFAHRRTLLPDLAWNLFYRFEFAQPPVS